MKKIAFMFAVAAATDSIAEVDTTVVDTTVVDTTVVDSVVAE